MHVTFSVIRTLVSNCVDVLLRHEFVAVKKIIQITASLLQINFSNDPSGLCGGGNLRFGLWVTRKIGPRVALKMAAKHESAHRRMHLFRASQHIRNFHVRFDN